MLITTAHILQGIELKKKATEEGRAEDVVLIDQKLTQLIDSLDMVQLLDLATELESRKIVDFGYPKKIISNVTPPSPTRSIFGLGWLIFKGKK